MFRYPGYTVEEIQGRNGIYWKTVKDDGTEYLQIIEERPVKVGAVTKKIPLLKCNCMGFFIRGTCKHHTELVGHLKDSKNRSVYTKLFS